jgi:hypothetical protein
MYCLQSGTATHPDELELGVLAQRVDCLCDAEHGADDVMARVAQVPELAQRHHGVVDALLVAALYHGLHFDRMWAVDDFEDVVAVDEAEAGVGRLQVVDCLSHVAFGGEDERCEAVVGILYILGFADLQDAAHDLGVGEAGVAKDGAS